jgi:hypothetical protein
LGKLVHHSTGNPNAAHVVTVVVADRRSQPGPNGAREGTRHSIV